MGPYEYVVERIDGDYAFLRRTDEDVDDLMQVARRCCRKRPARAPACTGKTCAIR